MFVLPTTTVVSSINSTYNYDTILLIILCNDGCSYQEVITIDNRFYVVNSALKIDSCAERRCIAP